MDRNAENGQALIELMIGLFLVLSFFFFTYFTSKSSIVESQRYRFSSVGAWP